MFSVSLLTYSVNSLSTNLMHDNHYAFTLSLVFYQKSCYIIYKHLTVYKRLGGRNNMYESGENYLETILMLRQKQGYVRSIDVANQLGFTKPSVSRAMSILKNNGYITVENSGNIVFTEKGEQKANEIYERHLYITKFLQQTLGISEELAAQDACRIEHIISQETFSRIKEKVDA